MRQLLTLIAALLILTVSAQTSRAQVSTNNDNSLAAALNKAYGEALGDVSIQQQRYVEATNNYSTTNKAMRATAANYNSSVDALWNSSPNIGMKTDFFNNVTSLRKKDDLDKWVNDSKEKWGATYGPRIREFNAYDGSEYSKYYDEKGDLMVTKVKGDYELHKRQSDDWSQAYKRANDTKDLAEKQYNDAVAKYGAIQTAGSEVADATGRLDQAQRRINDFVGKQQNSVNTGDVNTGGGAGGGTPGGGWFVYAGNDNDYSKRLVGRYSTKEEAQRRARTLLNANPTGSYYAEDAQGNNTSY